jgi:hypothetical protein
LDLAHVWNVPELARDHDARTCRWIGKPPHTASIRTDGALGSRDVHLDLIHRFANHVDDGADKDILAAASRILTSAVLGTGSCGCDKYRACGE